MSQHPPFRNIKDYYLYPSTPFWFLLISKPLLSTKLSTVFSTVLYNIQYILLPYPIYISYPDRTLMSSFQAFSRLYSAFLCRYILYHPIYFTCFFHPPLLLLPNPCKSCAFQLVYHLLCSAFPSHVTLPPFLILTGFSLSIYTVRSQYLVVSHITSLLSAFIILSFIP